MQSNDFHSPTWGVLESPTDLSSQFNVQDLPEGVLSRRSPYAGYREMRSAIREEGLSGMAFL